MGDVKKISASLHDFSILSSSSSVVACSGSFLGILQHSLSFLFLLNDSNSSFSLAISNASDIELSCGISFSPLFISLSLWFSIHVA